LPRPAVVALSQDYPASPQEVWRVASDWSSLVAASRGLLSYEGAPEGPLRPGQTVVLSLSFLGLFPPKPWTITIEQLDRDSMTMFSVEHGPPVRRWEHWMEVGPAPGGGARLSDRIEIDAGTMTPLYAIFARALYASRHPRRRRMLGV
jgi:hypothetical protein